MARRVAGPVLESDKRSGDFDAAKAELFEAISHPLRIKILQVLSEKPMGFAELGRTVGIASGGHLAFHLSKLEQLVRLNPGGDYVLTDNGREALWSVNALERANETVDPKLGRVPLRHKEWLKPVLAAIVLVLLVFGGISLFQQQEYASQQQELASQQSLIQAMQAGVPFLNAQSASIVVGQPNFASDGITTSSTGLDGPTQVLFDAADNLWITDTLNNRVLEFKPPFSNGMAASLVIGQSDFSHSLAGTSQTTFGRFPAGPTGATFDHSGDLWVADLGNNRVLEFTPPFSTGMSASLVIGQRDFATSLESVSRDTLQRPSSLRFDSGGDLWVLDSGNNRVLEYKPPFTDGMSASLVIGQSDFGVNGFSTSFNGLPLLCQAIITPACYLALDPSNNIWVGDSENSRIIEFRPPFSDGMNASFVIGVQDMVTNPGHSMDLQSLAFGYVVAFDSSGNLWTNQNDRMLVFRPPFVAGDRSFPSLEIGQLNFTATTLVGGQSGLISPHDPGFDRLGNLWVPDSNRILEFVALSPSNAAPTRFPGIAGTGQSPPTFVGALLLIAGCPPKGSSASCRRR